MIGTVNKTHMGVNKTIYELYSRIFENSNYAIIVEDDALLAKDGLIFYEYCNKAFSDTLKIDAVGGFYPYRLISENKQEPDLYYKLVLRANTFIGGTNAVWRRTWDRLDKNILLTAPEGYDSIFRINLNCNMVLPLISRSKNIGRSNGTYNPGSAKCLRLNSEEEYFDNYQNITYWSI